ncbi:methyltransferase domain-containing protein [Oricola cellulosilytica]|uniref:Methyltransferase domain-containing protein n=1 Tax=Oricola cellulosilytica TaxID=1429082 RepID=A0A4R0PBQ4_9HYPH|nr:methyltransferase domain-containing protein [Oricola cellulosilytica]TCD12367.1 methyltransferase domain-containing protein [Oricola cellulosilytica]
MIAAKNLKQLSKVYERALVLEKGGAGDEAAELYRKCLELDPDDHCGASVRLASLGLGDPPDKAPDSYVAMLFDQHAEAFDDILTGDLGYAVPMQLAEVLAADEGSHFSRMLDLGCGTGLSGMTLGHLCDHATGVDLSEKMIDLADERACYDELFVNEAVHFLEEWKKSAVPEHRPFDLIVATDVLPYVGALEPLFAGAAANANPGACFAFSSETLPDEAFAGHPWRVTPNQRFAHHRNYLNKLLQNHGFTRISSFEAITVRMEQGTPIPGWLVVAWRE